MTKHLKMQTTNSHHQPPKCMLKPPTTKKPDLEEGKKPATTMTYQKLPTTTSHCLKIRALNHKSEHKTTSNPQIRTLNHQISTNPTKPLQKPSKRKQKKTLTNLDQKPKTQKLRSKLKNLQGSEIKRRWDERSPLPLVVVAGRSGFGGARPWRLCCEREREREREREGQPWRLCWERKRERDGRPWWLWLMRIWGRGWYRGSVADEESDVKSFALVLSVKHCTSCLNFTVWPENIL